LSADCKKIGYDVRKVRRAIKEFNEKGLSCLIKRKAKGARIKFDKEVQDTILSHFSLNPMEFGHCYTVWTLPRFRKTPDGTRSRRLHQHRNPKADDYEKRSQTQEEQALAVQPGQRNSLKKQAIRAGSSLPAREWVGAVFRRKGKDSSETIRRTEVCIQRLLPHTLRPESKRIMQPIRSKKHTHKRNTLPILQLENSYTVTDYLEKIKELYPGKTLYNNMGRMERPQISPHTKLFIPAPGSTNTTPTNKSFLSESNRKRLRPNTKIRTQQQQLRDSNRNNKRSRKLHRKRTIN